MTAEGNLNKVDGDILYDGDIDAIVGMQGQSFKNQSQLLFNAARIGWNADLNGTGVPDYEDLYLTIDPDNEIDSGNSSIINTENTNYLVFEGFDETVDDFGDETIDTNIWSTAAAGGTAAVSETGGDLVLYVADGNPSTATAIADETNATDYKTLGKDSSIYLKIDWTTTGTSLSSSEASIYISDGTNHYEVWEKQYSSAGGTGSTYVRIRIDNSAETATAYSTDGTDKADVDISGGANWYIRFGATQSNNTGVAAMTFNIDTYAHNINDGANEETYQSGLLETASSTITNAILTLNEALKGSNVFYLSADNGVNFEVVTLNQIHNFTNTGTQLKLKIVNTGASSEEQPIEAQMYEFAILYNLY